MPGRQASKRLLGLFAVWGSAMYAPGAPAADAGAAAAADTESLDTITVTARKRDESLATVPLSVTVFTGQALENYG